MRKDIGGNVRNGKSHAFHIIYYCEYFNQLENKNMDEFHSFLNSRMFSKPTTKVK